MSGETFSVVRIGVMGCAKIATRSVIPAIRSLDRQYRLVAVASRDGAKATVAASEFGCEAVTGYEALLRRKDIEALYVPLPTGLHEEWVLKAIEAGKHLLVEKSLALSYDSARRMIDAAAARNLLVMENLMFVYHSQHARVRELVSRGEIGDLRFVRSSFGFPPLEPANFRYDLALGGGALLDAGTYTIRATRMFLGDGLTLVGCASNYDPVRGVDVTGGALFRNDAGVIAQVAFGFDNFYQCNYELWGTRGKLTAERAFTPPRMMMPRVTLEQQDRQQEMSMPADDQFRAVLVEFARAIAARDFTGHWEESLTQARWVSSVREGARA